MLPPEQTEPDGLASVSRINPDGTGLVDVFAGVVGLPLPLANNKWAYLDGLDDRDRGTLHVFDETTGDDLVIVTDAGGLFANVKFGRSYFDRADRHAFMFETTGDDGAARVLDVHLDRLE